MMRNTVSSLVLLAAVALGGVVITGSDSHAAGPAIDIPDRQWSWEGPFGTFERPALRRGLQVYAEVCSACHSLELVAYRNLGSIGFSEAEIKTFAAQFEVTDGPDEEGDMYTRPARPSDHFASPFANDNAARAANAGALPPDLSLMTKARAGGADYLHALLTGYEEPPAGFDLLEGMSYNAYFPGHQIAMAAPIYEDGVEYADGTPATVEQIASDVTTFLAWAAEPELEERKRLGIKVIIFLIVFTGFAYALKRKIWSDVH
ncbi:MAG: cytochrome c1 [Rhodospirillales bacterium]